MAKWKEYSTFDRRVLINPNPEPLTPELIEKYRAMILSSDLEDRLREAYQDAVANNKFKPPIRGWKLFKCRIKWYCYHVPRNWYIMLTNFMRAE